jgi:hypothetical protein
VSDLHAVSGSDACTRIRSLGDTEYGFQERESILLSRRMPICGTTSKALKLRHRGTSPQGSFGHLEPENPTHSQAPPNPTLPASGLLHPPLACAQGSALSFSWSLVRGPCSILRFYSRLHVSCRTIGSSWQGPSQSRRTRPESRALSSIASRQVLDEVAGSSC